MPQTGPRARPAARATVGSPWSHRLTQPGWLLLPLRAFLGLTFTYAGGQKLANPAYLNPHNPLSVAHQMQFLHHSSPIGPLLGLAAHAPTLVGLLIAFAELAVGLGTLMGLWVRAAAVGGALLSLTFFLTVSWSTSPYYYGSDIVFVFAWLVMLAFGAGGAPSVDGWLRNLARHKVGVGPEPATVAVAVPRLAALCGRGAKCGLNSTGDCTRLAGCPVFPITEVLSDSKRADLDRRTLLAGGAAATAVGALTLAVGGITAALGRVLRGGARSRASGLTPLAPVSSVAASTASSPPPTTVSGGATSSSAAATGTAIGATSAVAVGQAGSFTDPASGNPAYIVHTAAGTFVGFSAICTHAGCTVQYDPSSVEFICPCHGGVYDARTGQVLQGPPPSPLPTIAVHVVNGQMFVD